MNQPTEPGLLKEAQPNRACDPCRLHKVRCLPDTSSGSKACQRCARTDRKCVFTAPQRRKQRKRTDARVAELEREVQAMRALFENKRGDVSAGQLSKEAKFNGNSKSSDESPSITPSGKSTVPWTPDLTGNPSQTTYQETNLLIPVHAPHALDIIDRGVITIDIASQLLTSFIKDLAPHHPMVLFPPNTSASFLRQTNPVLFLACIAVSAAKTCPSLSSLLNTESLSVYAQRAVLNGEKSLELVQAMIVTSIWYYLPGRYGQLKFYEYIHMATTMAMDIGLGTNPNPPRRRREVENTSTQTDGHVEAEMNDLEKKRTFLACYIIATGVAMNLRRPSMLRSSSWLHECVKILSKSPNALPGDRALCAWVKLFLIAEEINTSFSFDDESKIANLSEISTQLMVKNFEKKLQAWKDKLNPEDFTVSLLLSYHHISMYLHEPSIHDEHPPEDFIPPYRMIHLLPTSDLPSIDITSSHISGIATLISSSHAILDTIDSLSPSIIACLPTYNFIRMAYATIVLAKLYVSARSPSSQIGAVLDCQSLKLGYYLKRLVKKLEQAVSGMECKAAYIFMSLLVRLDDWYDVQQGQDVMSGDVDLFEDGGMLSAEERRERQLSSMPESLASYIGNTHVTSQAQSMTRLDEGGKFTEQMGYKDVNRGLGEGCEEDRDSGMEQMLLLDGVDGFGFADSGWEQDMDIPIEFGTDDPLGLYDWGFQKS